MTDDAVVPHSEHPDLASDATSDEDPVNAQVEQVDGRALPIGTVGDSRTDVSLVVPTFNEAANIGHLLRSLHAVLTRTGAVFELIVVDDDSPDRTWATAAEIARTHPEIRVLRRTGASGLATAVICGWAHARGSVLGAIDGDGQHPPEVVADLMAA
ncbi:MAG TPA: sulfonate ABC transporter permease, partial [Acidimicrobiaceae bacterium]|nr:sulfonate ABC transporter permease [Acidimicrobiaceae bacterium]